MASLTKIFRWKLINVKLKQFDRWHIQKNLTIIHLNPKETLKVWVILKDDKSRHWSHLGEARKRLIYKWRAGQNLIEFKINKDPSLEYQSRWENSEFQHW